VDYDNRIRVIVYSCGTNAQLHGLSFHSAKGKKTETEQDAGTRAQLNYISRGVDDIKVDLRAQDRQMVLFGERGRDFI
jgi:hypothetical protein